MQIVHAITYNRYLVFAESTWISNNGLVSIESTVSCNTSIAHFFFSKFSRKTREKAYSFGILLLLRVRVLVASVLRLPTHTHTSTLNILDATPLSSLSSISRRHLYLSASRAYCGKRAPVKAINAQLWRHYHLCKCIDSLKCIWWHCSSVISSRSAWIARSFRISLLARLYSTLLKRLL